MPTATEEDQLAGNAEDSRNPGNGWYKPGKPLNKDEAAKLAALEADATSNGDAGSDGSVDGVRNGEKNGSRASRREKTRQARETLKMSAKFLSGSKKSIGSTGGIVGLLFALFGGSTVLLGPASLLTNLSTITGNHSDMGNRLYAKTGYSFIFGFLNGKDKDCATSKIKCKFATISESRKQKWEARGVKVISDPSITGRHKVRGLVFPNGTQVSTVRQWTNLRYTDPTSNSLLKRFPVRATYLNKKSAINKTLDRYKISLAARFASNKDKDKAVREAENSKSMNSKTGAVVDESGKTTLKGIEGKDKGDKAAGVKERLKNGKTAVNLAAGISTATVTACMLYDIIRATQASMLLLWHEELIKFAIPFLQAGAQAKEAGVNGEFDWETAEYYGDRLTEPVSQEDIDADSQDNITPDMLGKTAMDSKGMAAALNGDPVVNENYTGWAPINVVGTGVVKWVQDQFGKETIRNTCTIAAYTMWLSVGSCLAKLPQCLGTALVMQAAFYLWGDDLIELIAREISKPAIETIAKANLSDSLVGPPLSDAIVSASGVMSDYSDRAGGFAIAGTSDQALQAYSDTINDTDYTQSKLADAKQEASKNQFDATNKYSFAGQIATRIASIPNDGTMFSVFANMINSVAAIPLTANAFAMKQGVYQPIEIYQSAEKFNGTLNNCKNPGLNDLTIPCVGESGRTVPVLLPPAKDCVDAQIAGANRDCIEEAIDYLSGRSYNDKTFIDRNTGEPGDLQEYSKDGLDFDNPFLMFMRHCGNDRVYPIGYTDQPIDSKHFDWYIGKNCALGGSDEKFNDTDLAWGAFYYNECIALLASEEDTDYCWDDEAAPTTAPTPCGLSGSSPSLGSFKTGGDSNGHRMIIVHTTQGDSLEGMAQALQDGGNSYHVAVDESGKAHQLVGDDKIANGARGANNDSLHIAMVGNADQGARLDANSPQLKTVSGCIKEWAGKYNIPVTKVSGKGILNRGTTRGVAGHMDVGQAAGYTDRFDPGYKFPWSQVLANAK